MFSFLTSRQYRSSSYSSYDSLGALLLYYIIVYYLLLLPALVKYSRTSASPSMSERCWLNSAEYDRSYSMAASMTWAMLTLSCSNSIIFSFVLYFMVLATVCLCLSHADRTAGYDWRC